MIAGIGVDIANIDRFESLYSKYGLRFLRKILSLSECAEFYNHQPKNQAAWLAKRFAAKEALSKAFGTGLRFPMLMPLVSLMSLASGQPYFKLSGPLKQWSEKRADRIHLSISDEQDSVVAFVTLEKY